MAARDSLTDAGLDAEEVQVRKDSQRATAALLQAGIQVQSIWDLINTPGTNPAAVPVLIALLPQGLHWRVKEGIVRALTAKEARGVAAKPLVDEFLRAEIKGEPEKTELYKWAIGNALSEVADDAVFGDLARMVRDKRHGTAREMVAVALGRMKDPQAVDVLVDLLDRGQVPGHALIALGRLKAERARPHILPYLKHEVPWIRSEAKRALANIDKAEQRPR